MIKKKIKVEKVKVTLPEKQPMDDGHWAIDVPSGVIVGDLMGHMVFVPDVKIKNALGNNCLVSIREVL